MPGGKRPAPDLNQRHGPGVERRADRVVYEPRQTGGEPRYRQPADPYHARLHSGKHFDRQRAGAGQYLHDSPSKSASI
ncbi:hypothetical protein D3C87_1648590 [compost metagenome]